MSQDQGAPTSQPRALPAAPSYDVGYRKPPVQTRFKPGQSGNPKGRPKPQASLAQSLRKALFRKIKITENGEVKSIPFLDAMMMSMTAKALKGHTQTLKLLISLTEQYKVIAEPEMQRVLQIRFVNPDPANIAEFEKLSEVVMTPSAETS